MRLAGRSAWLRFRAPRRPRTACPAAKAGMWNAAAREAGRGVAEQGAAGVLAAGGDGLPDQRVRERLALRRRGSEAALPPRRWLAALQLSDVCAAGCPARAQRRRWPSKAGRRSAPAITAPRGRSPQLVPPRLREQARQLGEPALIMAGTTLWIAVRRLTSHMYVCKSPACKFSSDFGPFRLEKLQKSLKSCQRCLNA